MFVSADINNSIQILHKNNIKLTGLFIFVPFYKYNITALGYSLVNIDKHFNVMLENWA